MDALDPRQHIVLINVTNSNESVVSYRDYLTHASTKFAHNRAAESFRAGPLALPPLPSQDRFWGAPQ